MYDDLNYGLRKAEGWLFMTLVIGGDSDTFLAETSALVESKAKSLTAGWRLTLKSAVFCSSLVKVIYFEEEIPPYNQLAL